MTLRAMASERREQILRVLAEEDRIVASELAPRLGVSLDTIRRDLDDLAEAGALRRVHGGALPAPVAVPRRFADRRERDRPAKAAIAERAVGLVRDAAVLAMGGGTTVLEVARRLPADASATVVTSAPDVAVALLDRERLDVVVVGGRVDPASRTAVGAEAVAAVGAIRPDACVLGACALHAEAGLTVLDREEALVVGAMIAGAQRVVVVCTGDKLGTAGPYLVAPADRVSTVVTDDAAAEAEVLALRGRGVEVLLP